MIAGGGTTSGRLGTAPHVSERKWLAIESRFAQSTVPHT